MELDQAQPSPSPPPGSIPAADLTLIAGLRAKDRKATAEFVDRFAGPVEHYLRSRLWPRHDLVDDLVQDVFLAAWERLHTFRGDSPLRAWLLGIARHKVEDHYRAMLRAQPVPVEDIETAAGTGESIDCELDRTRTEEKLRATLAGLTPPYGVLLLWRYWEKRSLRDMAVETGRTEKAVERLLARAREQFRSKWHAQAGGAQ